MINQYTYSNCLVFGRFLVVKDKYAQNVFLNLQILQGHCVF